MITGYGQYKDDFFNKLNFPFQANKKILDVGCGDGADAAVFIKEYGLQFYGTDIYEHENISKNQLNFRKGSIYKLPYSNNEFDYVFTHDVLHHIDEGKQRKEKHLHGLRELGRVCISKGTIIIAEGNRYNPLFYPHMVKLKGHEHFRQSYLTTLIEEVFSVDRIEFKFFEAHFYPRRLLSLFKLYELVMENIFPRQFIAYNIAIITKK